MLKAGINDPVKVTRSALQNAASIAALFLTTEAVIADKPEKAPGHAGWRRRHGRHGLLSPTLPHHEVPEGGSPRGGRLLAVSRLVDRRRPQQRPAATPAASRAGPRARSASQEPRAGGSEAPAWLSAPRSLTNLTVF